MTVMQAPPMSEKDAALAAFHDEQMRALLGIEDVIGRGEAATHYITWLDACRGEASAVRDIAVYRMHHDLGMGAIRIANALGFNKARGQQLISRVAETYPAATQAVAKIKRRVSRG